MQLLYIAGIVMMAALVLKVGLAVYQNLIKNKNVKNKKSLDL